MVTYQSGIQIIHPIFSFLNSVSFQDSFTPMKEFPCREDKLQTKESNQPALFYHLLPPIWIEFSSSPFSPLIMLFVLIYNMHIIQGYQLFTWDMLSNLFSQFKLKGNRSSVSLDAYFLFWFSVSIFKMQGQ